MKNVWKFFGDNYSKCWKFGKECEWFLVFAWGLFALTFIFGFIFPIFFEKEIIAMIKLLMERIDGLGTLELIGFIFLNNLKASFFAFVLGIGFGILPIITCVFNGYLLGFVARYAVEKEGIFTLWKILPHGIFELPAVLFSIGIGIRLGTSVLSSDKKKKVSYVFREGLRFFIFVVFPLLIVAGIIEGILVGVFR